MAVINSYVTLAEYKAWATARGQTMATDATDDGVIEDILEAASRYIDKQAVRTFYPRVETRYYNVPCPSDRLLMLDDDLLAVTTLTNGDTTVLTTTDYYLAPLNAYPKFGVVLKESSDYVWETDSNSNSEGVISLLGFWGFHDEYSQQGWSAGGTLNEAGGLNATDLTFTMTAGHSILVGQIIKCENELMIVTTVATNDITVVKRGGNGSTAATHANGTAVTIWNPMTDVRQATLEIARNAYARRYGRNETGASIITEAGLELGPRDVSETAGRTIKKLSRQV